MLRIDSCSSRAVHAETNSPGDGRAQPHIRADHRLAVRAADGRGRDASPAAISVGGGPDSYAVKEIGRGATGGQSRRQLSGIHNYGFPGRQSGYCHAKGQRQLCKSSGEIFATKALKTLRAKKRGPKHFLRHRLDFIGAPAGSIQLADQAPRAGTSHEIRLQALPGQRPQHADVLQPAEASSAEGQPARRSPAYGGTCYVGQPPPYFQKVYST